MVGVPKKDIKTCHNCRRRRLKCDNGRPDCQRCLRAGRQCEGYERQAVFLNRTAGGLDRRQYFDEVQLRTSSSGTRDAALSTIPRPVDTTSTLAVDLRGHFLDIWLPTTDLSQMPPSSEWLLRACSLDFPNDLLSLSLGALTLGLVSLQRNDAAIALRARTMYGSALKSLQTALADPRMVDDDSTLAACQAMKLYEHTHPTRDMSQSPDHHIEGLTALLRHRGPNRNGSALSQALTRDIRYSAMVNGLRTRRKSYLRGEEWKTTMWQSIADVESSLIDHGLDIVALAEDMKTLMFDPSPVMTYLASALQQGAELQAWYRSAIDFQFIAPNWPAVLDDLTGASSSSASPQKLNLLRQSILMLDYWALFVVVSYGIELITSKLPPHMIPIEAAKFSTEAQLEAVHNILTVMHFQSREEHGWAPASRCTMPVRTTIVFLRNNDSESNRLLQAQAEAFLATLEQTRGARYIEKLSSVAEQWETGANRV